MALAAVTGISSAFAFNHPFKHKANSVTYYGVGTASNFSWKLAPEGSCRGTNIPNAACTITSTYDVTGAAYNNTMPAGATIVNGAGKLHN